MTMYYYDETTQEWVAKFVSYTSEGHPVPRAVRCKTLEQLLEKVRMIQSYH